jgi:Zn finger protein HypA/HybF involved in hydrogenase expression
MYLASARQHSLTPDQVEALPWRLVCHGCGFRWPWGAGANPCCPDCRSGNVHIHRGGELACERCSDTPEAT